jgi:hypothetical protein
MVNFLSTVFTPIRGHKYFIELVLLSKLLDLLCTLWNTWHIFGSSLEKVASSQMNPYVWSTS